MDGVAGPRWSYLVADKIYYMPAVARAEHVDTFVGTLGIAYTSPELSLNLGLRHERGLGRSFIYNSVIIQNTDSIYTVYLFATTSR